MMKQLAHPVGTYNKINTVRFKAINLGLWIFNIFEIGVGIKNIILALTLHRGVIRTLLCTTHVQYS